MTILSRFRWRLSIATAFILLALILSLGFAVASRGQTHAAGVPLTQISTDPYTNSTSQHATEVEPDTYSFGSTIVSAFQVGRFNNGGATNIGFATSTDGEQPGRMASYPAQPPLPHPQEPMIVSAMPRWLTMPPTMSGSFPTSVCSEPILTSLPLLPPYW